MASKKYEPPQGKSKIAMLVAVFILLGTLATLGYIYSHPGALFFAGNGLQAGILVAELKTAVNSLERELQLLRQESCIRTVAGPHGTVKSTTVNPLVIPDESVNPALANILKNHAINREILLVVATQKVMRSLKILVESVQRVGIRNYLIVALDRETANYCDDHNVPVYKRLDLFSPIPGTNPSGLVSNLKFHVLRDILVLGYAVLLSDVDIVYLQNPFNHLYRDSDVEGMTDGHSNKTSYGYIDTWDDPPMGRCRIVHSTRMWVFNSGLFYLRPTVASIELLDRVYARVSADPKLWDQDVYNEELMYPSRPGYKQLHISKRVMDYIMFMNSKTLFSIVRNDEKLRKIKPVTVHVNYHSKKPERMQAAVNFYVHGDKGALARFPEGEND